MNLFSHRKKGNYKAHDYGLMFCIHILNEYERKYNKNKLELYLSQCLPLKNKEHNNKYFQDLQDQKNLFVLWLLYITVARRNNLLVEMLQVSSQDDIDKYYYLKNKERWIINFEEYFKYLAKIAMDQLTLYDYKKLQEQYQALLKYWSSFLESQIICLKDRRDSLLKIIALQKEVISLIKTNVINETIAFYENLPPMNPQGEILRQDVISQAEKFRNNNEVTLRDLLEFRLQSKNKVLSILHDDGYSPEIISKIEDKYEEQDNNLIYGIALEDSNKFLEKSVAKLNDAIKKTEEERGKVMEEGRMPSYNFDSIAAIAEDNKKILTEQNKLIKDIDLKCLAAAEPNQMLIAEIKETNPQLTEKMDELIDLQERMTIRQKPFEIFDLLAEYEDNNNDIKSTPRLDNNP